MNTSKNFLHNLWVCCALVACGSVLVGVWNAQTTQSLSKQEEDSSATIKSPTAKQIEQIESTLARAGCPGWMVLASEGESALRPPATAVVPKDVRPTSSRVTKKVPRIKYPVPVRVATSNASCCPIGSSASSSKLAK